MMKYGVGLAILAMLYGVLTWQLGSYSEPLYIILVVLGFSFMLHKTIAFIRYQLNKEDSF